MHNLNSLNNYTKVKMNNFLVALTIATVKIIATLKQTPSDKNRNEKC